MKNKKFIVFVCVVTVILGIISVYYIYNNGSLKIVENNENQALTIQDAYENIVEATPTKVEIITIAPKAKPDLQLDEKVKAENRSIEVKPVYKEIHGLVFVKDVDESIVIDMRYSTTNNFTGKVVYPSAVCALRTETAKKLGKANKDLQKLGYRIKILDAYRPIAVQRVFWNIVKDECYVANPDKGGSNHNRGTAVDVTLVDSNGNELKMPSQFDDFSVKASRENPDMDSIARKNMDILTEIMVRSGFKSINTEWWHFDDADTQKYDVLDVDLGEFNLSNKQIQNEQTKKVDENVSVSNSAKDKKDMGEIQDKKDMKWLAKIGNSQQVIVVSSDKLNSWNAKLWAYQKVTDNWSVYMEEIPVVIGKNGFASDKKEGDKKTPIGEYGLKRCYGLDENIETGLDYKQFSQNDFWVDDPSSEYYNTFQRGDSKGKWKSAEDLYKIGYQYKYFVVIEYNTNNTIPGKGSAIFMHIWKNNGNNSTTGCVAMDEGMLQKLVKWLDIKKSPRIIMGPEGDIEKLVDK